MLIKLKEYERIFQIVTPVVESDEGEISRACIYYSLFGANILAHRFKLNAQVRCGFAVYHLGGDHQVLCFGEETEKGVSGTQNAFHCWVEAGDWVLDFMAPTFGKIIQNDFTSQPMMFQKSSLKCQSTQTK